MYTANLLVLLSLSSGIIAHPFVYERRAIEDQQLDIYARDSSVHNLLIRELLDARNDDRTDLPVRPNPLNPQGQSVTHAAPRKPKIRVGLVASERNQATSQSHRPSSGSNFLAPPPSNWRRDLPLQKPRPATTKGGFLAPPPSNWRRDLPSQRARPASTKGGFLAPPPSNWRRDIGLHDGYLEHSLFTRAPEAEAWEDMDELEWDF